MKTRDWLLLGAAGVAAWWLYRKFSNVGQALTDTGEKVGNALYDLTHPNDGGSSVTYLVHFSNGTFAVNASDVDKSGLFMFRGVQFKLVTDANGKHTAVAPEYGGIFK